MKYYVLALLTLAAGLAYGFRGEIAAAVTGHSVHQHVHVDRVDRADVRSMDFHWEGQVPQGAWIEIKGVNGGIEAVGTNGSHVVVRAEKTSKKGRAEDVRIEVVEHGDGVTVCSVYPSRSGRNSCGSSSSGSMDMGNTDVVVKYLVEVPSGIKFRGVTVNGSVSANGLTDAIRAASVNGSLDLETTGWAEAQTVNGSIHADVGAASPSGDMSFSTTNGRITVAVPTDLSADFEGRTMSGSIESVFPMNISGRYGQKRLEGVLGSGGPLIKLQTVNGSIQLVKRN